MAFFPLHFSRLIVPLFFYNSTAICIASKQNLQLFFCLFFFFFFLAAFDRRNLSRYPLLAFSYPLALRFFQDQIFFTGLSKFGLGGEERTFNECMGNYPNSRDL